MRRITPRTCLWPLVIVLSATFALSVGLTYRSNHHCYAGTCGEWLFPFQARLHVVVWYLWISLSTCFLGLRAFHPRVANFLSLRWKRFSVGGLILVLWIGALYGTLVGIWWRRLSDYFHDRGEGLPGNGIVAAVALMGHLADVTMGMVLLPVSRHSALASFFKLSHGTTYKFHITLAYVLFVLVLIHGSLYASWAAQYNDHRDAFRRVLPVLNPTYLYDEVWPGNDSALGIWRASLIFTGIVSGLIMLAMFLTSFPVVRRRHFNLFYFTHLFGILAVVIICLHASTMFYCTIPGLGMWLLDWGMRVAELREKVEGRLEDIGRGWYCITLPLPRKRLSGCACHSPLAHFFIHHSRSSILEIHPFTTITHLASKKSIGDSPDIMIQFLFRQREVSTRRNGSVQWTNKVASLIDEEKGKEGCTTTSSSDLFLEECRSVETTLRLEGPYFTRATPEMYKTVLCLVAGTGLSGALAIAEAFRAQSPGYWQRCIVVWSVRSEHYVDMPFFRQLQCEGLEFRTHRTGRSLPRLDFSTVVEEVCGGRGDDCWVYISGPEGFVDAAEGACKEVKGLTWIAARWA